MSIDSMSSDWLPHLIRGKNDLDSLIANMDQWLAAIEEAPVNEASKELAREVVRQLRRIPEQFDEINAVTRNADAPLWDLAEGNRPNKQAWTNE